VLFWAISAHFQAKLQHMKIYLSPLTLATSGGGLKGDLRNFDSYIQRELDHSGFESSFEEIRLSIAYPPMYVAPGTATQLDNFLKNYTTFPYVRLDRRYKRIGIILQAPEFSEHFHKEESVKYPKRLEIGEQYKNISVTQLAHILLDKYHEAITIIASKLKKGDRFDQPVFEHVLESIRKRISTGFLKEISIEHGRQNEKDHLLLVEGKRDARKRSELPKDKLIRDIRMFFKYGLPPSLHYLNRYTDIVLKNLVTKDFRCPGYHHLYISIAGTREEALKYAFAVEDWHTYGIAVLDKEHLLHAAPAEQQVLFLKALRDGLMDIAVLDGLDTDTILDAISEAKKAGILAEVPFKTKENNRIVFTISTKAIEGENKSEIYFTVHDKQTGRTAKWKFGKENIFVIGGWFGTLHVTNKKITTKPRAYMDLVLKGKEPSIVIDVEEVLSDPKKRINK
jgi:hypothetical protein